jgi:hypothetical protein
MRRVIAGTSNFADVGDTTTLSNPKIVDDIRHVQSEKLAVARPPRELTEQEIEEFKASAAPSNGLDGSRQPATYSSVAGGAGQDGGRFFSRDR